VEFVFCEINSIALKPVNLFPFSVHPEIHHRWRTSNTRNLHILTCFVGLAKNRSTFLCNA